MTFEFQFDTQGWTPHTLPFFTEPVLEYNGTPPGTLDITATDNISNFGYWESPPFALVTDHGVVRDGTIGLGVKEPMGSNIVALDFDLEGDEPDRNLVPEIRVRATALNSQQADVLVISSNSDGGISPYLGGRTAATLYFQPAAESPEFGLQFDMMNFVGRADSPTARVGLDSVDICNFVFLSTEQARTEAFFGFDSLEHNWTTESFTGFQTPIFGYDFADGALTLGVVPPGDGIEFGYWGSPHTGPLVYPEDGRLYFAEFTVTSDQTDATLVPNFRVRINESGFRVAQYVQASSTGPAFNSPTVGNPRTYTVFLPPNVATDGAYLIYSFDILTLSADGDSQSAVIALTELHVKSIALQ